MASRDSLEMNKLLGSGLIVNRQGQDTPVAIRLTHIAAGSVTSVIVTTATDITFVTSAGGTDEYLFSAYTTWGALVDAINAGGIFDAKILDGLRSKASANTILAETVTAGRDANNNIIYDVKHDTSTSLQYAACLSPHAYYGKANGHRVHLKEIKYGINMGTAAVNSVQIWKRTSAGVETQYAGILSVDTTETTISWASGEGFFSGSADEDIIVIVKDAATLGDATSNYIQVVGLLE